MTASKSPRFEFFNVAIDAADEAIEAVRKRARVGKDVRVSAVRTLTPAELASTNLRVGGVKKA